MRLSIPPFPNPVNEVTARVTAGGVVIIAAVELAAQARWIAFVLIIGFFLRVLSGPHLSPLARLSSRVIVPRLSVPPKMVPGPPKRFAQAIGLTFSVAAAALFYGFGFNTAGWIVLAALVLAALLESVVGLCLGCKAFAVLMRIGVIPEDVCESCNNIWARRPA